MRKLREIEVSPIGMGFSHGYGEIPDREYSIEAICKAYDFECTFLILRNRMVLIYCRKIGGIMKKLWGKRCILSARRLFWQQSCI